MAITTITCRFGKIVIDDQFGFIPTRTGKRMGELFPSDKFQLEEGFVSILNFIDFGNDLNERAPLPPEPYIHFAVARFEGSVSNYEISTKLRELDLLDTTIPEEDILWSISHFALPSMNGDVLCKKPYVHNLFLFGYGDAPLQKVIIENRPRIRSEEINWYMFKDDTSTQAYHISTEKLFFPLKKSALPF